MFRLSRILSILAVLMLSVLYTNTPSFAWRVFAATNGLYAVGVVKGTEKSYLYEINPVTGELNLIGDTGLNNCRGLDFNPEGKLKAFCETRGEVDSKTNALEAGIPVVAELDVDDGGLSWAVPHGVSNYISDITIREDGTLFSYENLKESNLHRHEEADDFQAIFITNPGIEAFDHGLAAWGDAELKVAANVDSTPSLYSVDSETGDVKLLGAFSFPDAIGVAAAKGISTRAEPALIQFASMDTRRIAGVDIPPTNTLSAAAIGYAFDENDADFAVLMKKSDMVASPAFETAEAGDWIAIGLIDLETLSVDYIVELPDAPVVVEAIAVRILPTREVPALSTAGIMVTGAVLLLIGLVFYKRKHGLSS